MSEQTKVTITLTLDQLTKLTFLAETTMTGERKEKGDPTIKTIEEITYQAIERGISAIQTTRTQYTKNKMYAKIGKTSTQSK